MTIGGGYPLNRACYWQPQALAICGDNCDTRGFMSGNSRVSFGSPAGAWKSRPGAYGIALRAGSVLAVEFERRLYLPGGATEEGESPEDALRREFMEETGYSLLGAKPLLGADQFGLTTKGEWFRKECSFFIVHVNLASNPPGQPNHLVRWLLLPEGLGHFAEEASRYAAKIAFTGVDP